MPKSCICYVWGENNLKIVKDPSLWNINGKLMESKKISLESVLDNIEFRV